MQVQKTTLLRQWWEAGDGEKSAIKRAAFKCWAVAKAVVTVATGLGAAYHLYDWWRCRDEGNKPLASFRPQMRESHNSPSGERTLDEEFAETAAQSHDIARQLDRRVAEAAAPEDRIFKSNPYPADRKEAMRAAILARAAALEPRYESDADLD